METASFSGLIRDIFYLLLLYYAVKFITQLFAAKKATGKSSDQFHQQQNQNQHSSSTQSEKPKEKKKVGEYIDFEEVE